jgi:hypothetical protein
LAAKTTTTTYWVIDTTQTNWVSSGTSFGSQTQISNVIGYRFDMRPVPADTATIQAQIEVVVYDTSSNAAIIAQGPAVIPDGYTDFKGLQPHKYLRSRAGDVIAIKVSAGPGSNYGDFYVTDASIAFGASGDAVLLGTNT